MSDPKLFEETFTISERLDKGKYENVRRWKAHSITQTIGTGGSSGVIEKAVDIELDVYNVVFPVEVGQQFTLAVATTLALDGSKPEKGWREKAPGETDLSAGQDYVVHATVYKFEEGTGDNIDVYFSYGGLLGKMSGPYRKLTPLRVQEIYVLCKRA